MRRHQSGIFLVSAAIAVGVVGMLVTFWGVEQSRQMRMARAERIGESLNMVGNAVETFTVKHHSDIEKLLSGKERSFTVNGVTFKSADTGPNGTAEIADLSADDVIRALQLGGVATTPPRGVGNYALRVYRVCDAGDARSCRIDTLTYLTEPIKKTYSSEPDLNLAVVAAKKMGVYGGLSSMNEADKFNFIGQTSEVLPVANPLGPIPGIIVMRGGSQTKDLNNTVMRDGSRDMTGSLKFASTDTKGASVSRDIVGAENIQASGTLNVGSIVAGATAVKGTLDLGSEANRMPVHNNIVNAGNIEGKGQLKMASASVGALVAEADGATINGKLNLSNNDIEAAKSVSAGKVSAEKVESRELKSKSGVVELGDAVTEGEVCDVWGLGRDTHGRILSCQKNDGQSWRWTLAMRSPTVPEVKKPEPPPPKPVVAPPRNGGKVITTFTLVGTNTPNRSKIPGFKLANASSSSTQCKFSDNAAIDHINSIGDHNWGSVFKSVSDGTDHIAPGEFVYFPRTRSGYGYVVPELVCVSTGNHVPVLLRLEEVLGYGAVPRGRRQHEGRPVVDAVLAPIRPTKTIYESDARAFRRSLNNYNRIKFVPQVYQQGSGGGWKARR